MIPVPVYRLTDLQGEPVDANFHEEEIIKVTNEQNSDV
jgi:hypothetical protein